MHATFVMLPLSDYCTVKVAELLVTLPSELLTVTVKTAPLSAALVADMV